MRIIKSGKYISFLLLLSFFFLHFLFSFVKTKIFINNMLLVSSLCRQCFIFVCIFLSILRFKWKMWRTSVIRTRIFFSLCIAIFLLFSYFFYLALNIHLFFYDKFPHFLCYLTPLSVVRSDSFYILVLLESSLQFWGVALQTALLKIFNLNFIFYYSLA